MTTLVPHNMDDLSKAVVRQEISFTDVMQALAQANAEVEKASKELPAKKAPAKLVAVVLSPEERKALRTLPAKIADVELPTGRKMTEDERLVCIPLFDEIKTVRAALDKAEAAYKEAFHGHLDILARAADPDVETDRNGHALTEGEVTAPGLARKVVRGLTGGNAGSITDADLQQMVADGEIDRAAYLRMTKALPAQREVVPAAVMAELGKKPSLLSVIGRYVKLSAKGTAIRMAKV